MYRNTYVEINIDNIIENVKNIIEKYNNYKYYIGVIKGHAYGHGEYIAKYIIENGINYLAVSSLDEAIETRKYIFKDFPILCLEPIPLEYIPISIDNNVTLTISNIKYYDELKKLKHKNIKFHLKLNTGMNRLGINNIKDVEKIYNETIDNDNLKMEGIYTHLSTNGVYDKLYKNQLDKFNYLTSSIDLNKIKIVHIGRSTTLDFFPKIEFANAVRIGIMMYGIKSTFPSDYGIRNKLRMRKYAKIREKYNLPIPYIENNIELKQAFSLCSEVIDIQKVKRNEYVGYGSNNIILNDGYIATIPIGYADGLSTNYKKIEVTINKQKYKVIGTINMGMITVFVDDKVSLGDKVEVISMYDSYKEIAKNMNITPYVLMTSINNNVRRVYIKDNKIIS